MEESTNVKIMSIKKNKAAQRSAKTIVKISDAL